MEYKHYRHTAAFISARIAEKFPKAIPKEDLEYIPGHLLWMISEMQEFDDQFKAARWIGWILAHAEMLDLMTNSISRQLIRQDVADEPM